MDRILKAKETMTARQRVQKTFQFEKTDRVTIGYETNMAVHMRLAEALGIRSGDMEQVFQALGVDYRGVDAPYVGPNLFDSVPGRQTNPVYGYNTRWVENSYGGYSDFCDFPLKGVDDETIAAFPVPDPNHFDYSNISAYIHANREYAMHVGNPGLGDIMNTTGFVMGMEDTYMNLMTENEATLAYVDRRLAMQLAVTERILDKNRGEIDFMWLGEDLGTQHTPLISLDMYRKVLRPRHQRFVDLADAYHIPVMIHTCGSSSWVYEDFIEMGIRGVDTLQPEAVNMSPGYLKQHFGGRLCFRGCISTAGPLAYGTPEETAHICRDTLAVMMEGYGYHFAPTHQIQDNTPTGNVIAMYQAAHDFGVYK
jgi:uroporphyrinogen decarboxylase